MPNNVKKIIFYIIIATISWKYFTSFNVGVPKYVKDEINFNRMPQPTVAKECLSLLKYKNYSDAVFCYSSALSNDEENSEIRYYYAYSLFLDKRYTDSMAQSAHIVKNEPKSKYAIYAKALYDDARIEAENLQKALNNGSSNGENL